MSNKSYNKTSRTTKPEEIIDETQELPVTPEEVAEVSGEPERDIRLGTVVNCLKLRVRKDPSLDGEEMYVIKAGGEVEVDLLNSTDEFYLVRTSSGSFDGYCMRQYIDIGE